ncbi:defensin-like [Diachasma alloeum]|uniref:defensin-like n=1 Tax=Diachasma alloeum TaxID=454923 RepID=UPI0010FBA920|nr:defensin-like [Diachasma alloeum]
MAKFLIFSLFVAMAIFSIVAASPVNGDLEVEDDHLPQPRVICDLIGVGDRGCAARCILQGKRGGWCEKGVCHCRN